MINAKTALAIADEHIAAQPSPLEGRIVRHQPHEVDEGWYFEYGVECDLTILQSERELFAGAPGFIVARDNGDVRVVPREEWSARGLGRL